MPHTASSTTVFARCPAALSLPTADPAGLAVEIMLRFAGVRASRRDSRLGALSLTIHSPDTGKQEGGAAAGGKNSRKATAATEPPEVCEGLMPCLKRLSSEEGVAQLSGAMTAEATCVEVLTQQCIFPAFLFAVHFDPMVYRAAMAKSVEPKVASFWEGITGSYREHVLRSNPYFYTGSPVPAVPNGRLSLSHVAKLKEVGEEVDKAFAALEAMCAAKSTSADALFFLGTRKPTHVDALVYAAASSFFHADTGDVSAGVLMHQQRLMDACPHLLQYTERLRRLFFGDSDSGTYCLKPRNVINEDAAAAIATAAEQQFRKGRLQTLIWTGVFATVYFVLANADMVVSLLEEAVAEEEEALAAQTGTTAKANVEGGGGDAAPREPREL